MAHTPMTTAQEDALRMACFLFNLEQEEGPRYIMGGMWLSDVIDGFCRFTRIERAVWEAIVWPDQPITPRKDAS